MSSKYRFSYFIFGLIFSFTPFFTCAQACVDENITALPFAISSTTCGMVSDYGDANTCSSWMMSGEDITFSYTTLNESCLAIELSGFIAGAAGIIVTSTCPDDLSGDCINNTQSNWGETTISTSFFTEPNTTYLITISSSQWTANCIDFDFSLSSDCPDPTSGDCLGALNICDDYYLEPNAPNDAGNFLDDLGPNGCSIAPTANGGWYSFTIENDGLLSFTLTPLNADDYDWALFNLTNATCSDLSTNPNLLVSCNSYGLIGANGPTGISSAQGGTGNANGPGNLAGPPFNEDLPVLAGETYALFVSNWSGTPNGYEIDFGESTANFIDNVLPEVESVTASCHGISVEFSEYMDCTTALPEHFTLDGPGGPYSVTNIESSCSNGLDYGRTFVLEFDNPFPVEGGEFTLIFEADELADMCGNFLDPIEIPVIIQSGMALSSTTAPAACGNSNGEITVNVESGGTSPFSYQIENEPFQTETNFTNLAPGDYLITVRDFNDCRAEIIVTVENEVIEFTAGTDAHVCELFFSGNASLPPAYTGQWTAPSGIQMSDDTSPNCVFTANEAGDFTLTWTITNNINCVDNKSVTVSFNNLSVNTFNISSPSCHDDCDANATVTIQGAANSADLIYEWSNGNSNPTSPYFVENLCHGTQMLSVSTSGACNLEVPFVINNPEKMAFNELVLTKETCPDFCDAQIEIESVMATQYSFDGGETFSGSSTLSNMCAGDYHLILLNDNLCETDTFVNLAEPIGPKANFYSEVQRKSYFEPDFKFENASQNYISSYWLFDYPDGLDYSRENDPEYTYPNPELGDYTVMLVVSNEIGCRDTSFQTVGIFEDTWVYIPNSFTPNGDGINDIFKPSVLNVDIDDYRLEIFDRWGQKVFATSDLNQGWDGGIGNTGYFGSSEGYAYRIHIRESESGDTREWNGMVFVLR